MKHGTAILVLALIMLAAPAGATGLYSCDSSPRENWQSREVLTRLLTEQGWQVRRIKEDGGCWEVYALDAAGDRVEAYFDPVTLKNVYTSRR